MNNSTLRNRSIWRIILLHLICTIHVVAQSPELINYQGKLVDGTNLVSGTATFGFQIYDSLTNGSIVYAETQTVTVIDGLYSAQIGASNAVPGALMDALNTTGPRYLQLVANETPLSPRERITAVAYALRTAAPSYTTIPLWQAGVNFTMSNTSGQDLSNCEAGIDPTLYNSAGNIAVRLVVRITSASAGIINFQLRAHDGTTEAFPIVNTDSWTFASTQSGLVAISEWKEWAAGTNPYEIHLYGWVDAGSVNFISAYLMIRDN